MAVSFTPQDFRTVYAMEPGCSTNIVNAATAPGPAASYLWGVSPNPTGGAKTAVYSTRGTYSVCTATLKVSLDNQVTFNTVLAAIDVAALPAGTFTNLVTGGIYRLDVTTFTGTSISIDLVVS